jgi:hypothetical protein
MLSLALLSTEFYIIILVSWVDGTIISLEFGDSKLFIVFI